MNKALLILAFGLTCLQEPARAEPPAPNEDWSAFAAADGVQRITLQCGSNFIDPRRVVVKAHARVELTIYSPKGLADQAFVLRYPGADVTERLGPKAIRVSFHPGAVGRYRFLCGPGHAAASSGVAGQGQLTVVP